MGTDGDSFCSYLHSSSRSSCTYDSMMRRCDANEQSRYADVFLFSGDDEPFLFRETQCCHIEIWERFIVPSPAQKLSHLGHSPSKGSKILLCHQKLLFVHHCESQSICSRLLFIVHLATKTQQQ